MTDPIARQRRKLLFLAALFFLPIAASFTLYYATSWRPVGKSNHGELIVPARPVPEVPDSLRGKWVLAYVGDGRCDADCQRSLVFARQTRLSLNQEMDRVVRVLFATTDCCDQDYLDREHQGLKVLDLGDAAAREPLLAVLPAQDREHSLFIIDPLGNLVMRYDTRDDPRGLLTDLKKLLQLSHIG
ncbi:MAG: hypothetical protein QM696_10120 [Steroidobacteraceae bacterium]